MKRSVVILVFLSILINAHAEEGMFIPMFLGEQRIARMQSLGLRLSASDIYDVNNASLKDAIVLFGRGCTGVIVSDEGLLLTNHHCGFGTIQTHSTLEHDYLTDGFWAASRTEELANPGLTVTLLAKMEEVTEQTLSGVTEKMTEAERSRIIRENIEKIEKEAVKEKYQDARVRSFYYGNQYFLFITETYKDVRLVGAPPSDIGDYGGDTDNWMWPRHTGDFAIFRIYAGKDNKPADYSSENIPFKPRKSIAISLQGYDRGDFTFVFGFPGSTREYLPSTGVEMIAFTENPIRIGLRQSRLDIYDAAMQKDPLTRIQYASKHKGIANYWKKMIGETRGIRKMDAVSIKKHREQEFLGWVSPSQERSSRYGGLFEAFERTYGTSRPLNLASVYLTEAGMGIELVRLASGYQDLIALCSAKDPKSEDILKETQKLIASGRAFYKNYQPGVDQQIASKMLPEMDHNMEQAFLPPVIKDIRVRYNGDFTAYSVDLFKNSVFADSTALMKILVRGDPKKIARLSDDVGFELASGISATLSKQVVPELLKVNARLDSLQRIYMAALMEMGSAGNLYPDANSTLRVAYGIVDNYSPADAVTYNFYTTVEGLLAKHDPAIPDYVLTEETRKILGSGDYGRYADQDGTLHTAFIASNHTTGGNSGSPVLNADGNLLGLYFDRNWEGTMSDLVYDTEQCRNIVLDIRYCLFVIDRIGKAGYLLDEMSILE